MIPRLLIFQLNLFQVYVEELEHTPREHRAVQVLAAIGCYVSEWHDKGQVLVRPRLARIPRQWAADLDLQVEEAYSTQAESSVVERSNAFSSCTGFCALMVPARFQRTT